MEEEQTPISTMISPAPDLSTLAITLLKGVIYREGDERLWGALLNLQARVREHVSVIGLELILDEAEGYAFLKSRHEAPEDEAVSRIPRLIARRPLSFPVSLLLALLRKKLAEFDAGGNDTRLVLTREEIVELVRLFMPDSTNEVKIVDQIEMHINKVVDLGFLRRLKTTSGPVSFEVQRILKAFVDAQWLATLDAQLASYKAHLAGSAAAASRGTGDD